MVRLVRIIRALSTTILLACGGLVGKVSAHPAGSVHGCHAAAATTTAVVAREEEGDDDEGGDDYA